METPLPGKTIPPTVPIPVEESRAQRLQRSQARFRDRGGIFVPTTRNTLVDILLGRKVASPKKGRTRSASLSPKKNGAGSKKDTPAALRTSPRKAAQRQMEQASEPEAGPSRLTARKSISKPKPTKKAKSGSTTAATAQAKGKTKSENVTDTLNDDDDAPPAAASKRAPKTAHAKRTTKKKNESKPPPSSGEVATEDASPIEPPAAKPKRTTKAASKRVPKAKSRSKIADEVEDCDPLPNGPSQASLSELKPKRSPVRDHDSESEHVPAKQRSRSKKTAKTNSQCLDVPKSSKTAEASKKESQIEDGESKAKGKEKGKGKVLPDIAAVNDFDSAAHVTQPQPSTKRTRPADRDTADALPQSKRTKVTTSQDDKPSAPPIKVKAPARKKKAPRQDEDLATNRENIESPSPPSKKRARDPDEDEPIIKRVKTRGKPTGATDATEDIQRGKPKTKGGKANKAASSKTPRANSSVAKPSRSNKSSGVVKAEPGAVIITRLRPRHSIMLRINQSPGPLLYTNDPDPIDFLG